MIATSVDLGVIKGVMRVCNNNGCFSMGRRRRRQFWFGNMTISTQIKKKKKKLIVWLRPSWEILRPELCFHETAAEKKMSKVL
jgi:hypothetical protein